MYAKPITAVLDV